MLDENICSYMTILCIFEELIFGIGGKYNCKCSWHGDSLGSAALLSLLAAPVLTIGGILYLIGSLCKCS